MMKNLFLFFYWIFSISFFVFSILLYPLYLRYNDNSNMKKREFFLKKQEENGKINNKNTKYNLLNELEYKNSYEYIMRHFEEVFNFYQGESLANFDSLNDDGVSFEKPNKQLLKEIDRRLDIIKAINEESKFNYSKSNIEYHFDKDLLDALKRKDLSAFNDTLQQIIEQNSY